MPVVRLNHAVLYVSNLERSITFYRDVLGFTVVDMAPEGFKSAAFLRANGSTNDHDLGLFSIGEDAEPSPVGRGAVGLYHLAWEVDTLAELEAVRDRLAAAGALGGTSDHGSTKSLYGKDPDGLEFEVVWLIPAELLDEETLEARKQIQRLDLEKEKRTYGAHTQGGIGISR